MNDYKRSRIVENLETAIQKNFPSLKSRRKHNLSMGQNTAHHNYSKEIIIPSHVNPWEIMDKSGLSGCLTERNNHMKNKKEIYQQDIYEKRKASQTRFKINNLSLGNDITNFKTNKLKLRLSKWNLEKIQSLKNKTREIRRKSLNENISVESSMKLKKSNELKLSKPKIMKDMMIPAVFRRERKEVPSLKVDSDQKWHEYSAK